MNSSSLSFLGFALAASDASLEIAADGTIGLSAGATSGLFGHGGPLSGVHWKSLIAEDDHPLVDSVLCTLKQGERRGPVVIHLALKGRRVSMSVFHIPQLSPNVSCTISTQLPAGVPLTKAKGEYGLHDPEGFASLAEDLLSAARAEGVDLDLAMIEMAGYDQLCKSGDLDAQGAVAAAVRGESLGGCAAAQLGGDRFAVVRSRNGGEQAMKERLVIAAQGAGLSAAPAFAAIRLEDNAPVNEALRTMKWALETFLESGLTAGGENVASAFRRKIAATNASAAAFKSMVRGRNFSMVYQPIVSLKDAKVHHFEALARFPDQASTFETIRLAEQLELIDGFDLAVAGEVVRALHLDGTKQVKVAINVSAQSLMDAGFVENLLATFPQDASIPSRVLFEITESAAITDLQVAEQRIQSLRSKGFAVWLDDFGAGAASLGYLQALSVDGVKIDGKYIKEIASGRNIPLVKHIAALCKELGMVTVAEQVETSVTDAALRRLGIDYGQGWFYGRPQANLTAVTSLNARAG